MKDRWDVLRSGCNAVVERDDLVVGTVAGIGAALVLSALLVPVRADVDSAVVALPLVLPVLLGAAIGGRTAGALCAVTATISFDFFFTVPYGSLKMHSTDDVVAALVLLVVGSAAGTLSARAQGQRSVVERQRLDLDAIHAVAALVVDGARVDEVVEEARRALVRVLRLERCDFVEGTPSEPGLPEILHAGAVTVTFHRYAEGGFMLPSGSQLPVRGRAGGYGRFVLHATEGVAVPVGRTRAAVVIADLVGAAFDTDPDGR